jgi:predicted transcriptional regulator
MPETLHALVQGSSGSGKTHLVRQITDFMPLENVIRLTRVTESSFYNYGEYDLQSKLVVIEDYDGLKDEAELAFRELQSNDELRSSVSAKDTEYGSYRTQIRVVKGPISSMAATTKGAIYEDNLSRCFVIAVDESKEQTVKIIDYQNKKAAGEIKTNQKDEIQTLLQNCIRLLKPMEVINPFASKMKLPEEAFKIRRLNSNFQSFVKQITLLNQYQRKKDKQGRLITAKEDLQIAIEIMFDSIILKVDELDGSLRDFYEKLKEYVQTKGKEYEFTQREIRQDLRISKTQMQRFINDLLELEYIERKGSGMHGATKYKISYWDDNTALKQRIKDNLNTQLAQL